MEVNNFTQEALARLPREELRRILAEELHKDTKQIDGALVRALLAELRNRGSDPFFTDDEAINTACEKFRQDTKALPKSQTRWHQHWLFKVASVVLVLGLLFFSLPAAEAKSIPDVLTWWSDSLFQLFDPGEKPNTEDYVFQTDHPGLQEIYDTVTEAGITTPIVPSKLSGDFNLFKLKTLAMQEDISIHASLKNDNNEILFTAIVHSQQSAFQHEKTLDDVSVWSLGGIDHYVLSNNDTLIVTWVTNNIECTVTTDCPEEEVYRLIKSIYTSED